MSISVHISNLSWSAADGARLFTDLNLSFGAERTGLIGRNGIGKSTLLQLIAGERKPLAGTISVTGAIAEMRQQAIRDPGDSLVDLLGVRRAYDLLSRAEAGLATLEELTEAEWDLPARINKALQSCGLQLAPETRLDRLSGGQRSRAGLSALVMSGADMLLLDEPTNNLDQEGRRAVMELVQSWRGGAIVVSHDRELLECMDAIVELTSLGAKRYGGNYTAYQRQQATELEAAKRDLGAAETMLGQVERRAQQAVERKARKDSAGRRQRTKGGQAKVLLDAAKGRAEASGGAGTRLRDERRSLAQQAVAAAREKIEIREPLNMALAPTGLSADKTVLRLERISGGADPTCPVIRDLSLTLTGQERVVIAGPNGSGKTTLLKLATGQMPLQAGKRELGGGYAMLDQHLGLLFSGQSACENFLRLNPRADTNMAHAALARFGFRAQEALRDVSGLSGGERLRCGLACVLGATPPPALLILDEPTNHLDLDGIAALEAALQGYDGAVLAVSHDRVFLSALSPDRVVHLPS
jgi:ATPase subunit of ABC transporter with duplicated ATPase domains